MRIVLDTNVVVSAAASDGLCRRIVGKRTASHTLITSQRLLDELRQTLRRKFAVELDDFAFLTQFRERAELVMPLPLPKPVCRDADDDMVLATALAGSAECIITGDEDLLVLKKFRRIRILSPRQFLELLDRPS